MKDSPEQLSSPYNEHAKNWQKSAEEIARFILNHLTDRPEFVKFIQGEEIRAKVATRYQERLEDLLDKAEKNQGYGLTAIARQRLLDDARQKILDWREAGELPPVEEYENFCKLPSEDFKLRA